MNFECDRMIVLGRFRGERPFFVPVRRIGASDPAWQSTNLIGGGDAACPTLGQKRAAPAVPFPICQARYAEREPATGRAVLLDEKSARSIRPESSPGTAGPHEFNSTTDYLHPTTVWVRALPGENDPWRFRQQSSRVISIPFWYLTSWLPRFL